ncbi:hypothetical protein PRIC1_011958 [Phytophthora ramorum]
MEDHTVGNALRYPDVDFCGYMIPHPSEPKMHMRLQTHQGLTDLRKVSTQITDAYLKELKAFKRKNRTN